MALEHLYTVLCDNLVIAQDERPTLVGCFMNIGVHQFPAVKAPMGIAMAFTGGAGEAYVIQLQEPGGELTLVEGVVEPPGELASPFQQYATSLHLQVATAGFRAGGVYAIVLRDGSGRQVHRHPFGVFVAPQPVGAVEVVIDSVEGKV